MKKRFLSPADKGIKGRIGLRYRDLLLHGQISLYKVPLWLMQDPDQCVSLVACAMRSARTKGSNQFKESLQSIFCISKIIEASAKNQKQLQSAHLLRKCYEHYLIDLTAGEQLH